MNTNIVEVEALLTVKDWDVFTFLTVAVTFASKAKLVIVDFVTRSRSRAVAKVLPVVIDIVSKLTNWPAFPELIRAVLTESIPAPPSITVRDEVVTAAEPINLSFPAPKSIVVPAATTVAPKSTESFPVPVLIVLTVADVPESLIFPLAAEASTVVIAVLAVEFASKVKLALPVTFNVLIVSVAPPTSINCTLEALPSAFTVNVSTLAPPVVIVAAVAIVAPPNTLSTPRVAEVKAASKVKPFVALALSTKFTVVVFAPNV